MDSVKVFHKVTILVIYLLLGVTLATSAFGEVTYTYNGNAFTDFSGSPPSFLTAVSGYFTLPSLLISVSQYYISPLEYSFTNGVDTLTNENSGPVSPWWISTDSSGNIIGWNIHVRSPSGNAATGIQIGTQYIFNPNLFPIDSTAYVVNFTQVWVAWNELDSGTWIVSAAPEVVTIDIKPGDSSNNINLKSKGIIPVAILSTNDFYAPRQIVANSLTFGRTGNEESLGFCPTSEDVNRDGLQDMVCRFETQDAGFVCGDTKGILKGKTYEGTSITGSDSVSIDPCKK